MHVHILGHMMIRRYLYIESASRSGSSLRSLMALHLVLPGYSQAQRSQRNIMVFLPIVDFERIIADQIAVNVANEI